MVEPWFGHQLREPVELGVVGAAAVALCIPVVWFGEMGDLGGEEEEMGAATVEVGVDEIGMADGGEVFGIKEPDGAGWIRNPRETNGGVIGARAIDMLIETVVKEVATVGSTSVGGAKPDGSGRGQVGVGAPGLLMIGGQTHVPGQLNVPTRVGVAIGGIGEAFGRQLIVVIVGVGEGRDAPLTQVLSAQDGVGGIASSGHAGQGEGSEDGEDGDDGEQFDQAEGGGGRSA